MAAVSARSHWLPWRVTPARLAAVLLLAVWVGPVSVVQTDLPRLLRWLGAPGHAIAESRVVPAGLALFLEPGTHIKLHLHDGSDVEGRFLGRALLDSTEYAVRFAAYERTASPSCWVRHFISRFATAAS